MPRKRKRKFSLLSAVFLELASLAGIIAFVQPALVLSWFGVDLHSPKTTIESASKANSAELWELERAQTPLTDWESSQVVETSPRAGQGWSSTARPRTLTPGWVESSGQMNPNQTSRILPNPQGESFPRLATRQPLEPLGHRPTWDYSYPRPQVFP